MLVKKSRFKRLFKKQQIENMVRVSRDYRQNVRRKYDGETFQGVPRPLEYFNWRYVITEATSGMTSSSVTESRPT